MATGSLYIVHLLDALWAIVLYLWHSVVMRRPVSYPGDPLKNPLRRKGDWPKDRPKFSVGDMWSFASDWMSHEVSQKVAPDYPMTGESAGRQIWFGEIGGENPVKSEDFDFNPSENPNSGDKLFRAIMQSNWEGERPDESFKPSTAGEAAHKGFQFYQMLQCEDGHWAGDYGGPMFLMPGLICCMYITKVPFPEYKKKAMVAYLRNHQQTDGGWGTHIECASTMFGTILSYVALRLLGEGPNEPFMEEARDFIMCHGGALYAPSWAKFWMAVIGVYHWDGVNSIPAEMWFLPDWFPFHPGKLWCHCRMVYVFCYTIVLPFFSCF
jgi:hypothetical protein